LQTTNEPLAASVLVNCAGLQSDRVARRAGTDPGARIVPFRGEYYELVPEAQALVSGLIYPVPDPTFPFLGVHFTRMIDGSVHCGPNAVLAAKREGYRWRDVSVRDLADTFGYSGFWRLAGRHGRSGAGEVARSLSKHLFVRSLQRLVPELTRQDVTRSAAGVRAQALAPDGSLIDDFLIVGDDNAVHVCNAPSPAATSSLEIGRVVAERVVPAAHSGSAGGGAAH
jgi:L-2-hydroxyglutarate oxidase